MNGPFFIAMLNYQYSRAWIAYVFVPVRSNHVSAPICCILITTFLNVSILSPYICSMCLPYSLRIFPIFSLCILIFNGSTPPRFLSQPCMSKRPSGPDTAEEDFATSGAWQFEQQTWGEFQWWFLWWFHEAYDVWVISGQTDNFWFGIWAMSATNLDMWGLNQPFHWDILKV